MTPDEFRRGAQGFADAQRAVQPTAAEADANLAAVFALLPTLGELRAAGAGLMADRAREDLEAACTDPHIRRGVRWREGWPMIPGCPDPPGVDPPPMPRLTASENPGERFPDRLGTGDRPGAPCRVISFDIAPPPAGYSETSGREILDSIAEFYRHAEPRVAPPERISVHPDEAEALAGLVQSAEQPPWGTSQLAGLMGVPVVSDLRVPPGTVRIRTDGEDRDAPLRGPAPGMFTAPVSGRYEITFDLVSRVGAPLDPEPDAARDWAAQGSVCCHVCGPDPGHVCDARAVASIRFPIPSGGQRTLPLCGPCHQAESRAASVAP